MIETGGLAMAWSVLRHSSRQMGPGVGWYCATLLILETRKNYAANSDKEEVAKD